MCCDPHACPRCERCRITGRSDRPTGTMQVQRDLLRCLHLGITALMQYISFVPPGSELMWFVDGKTPVTQLPDFRYQDRRAGVFTFADKKAITMTEVLAYVHKAQLMQASVNRADEVEDLKIQILRHDLRQKIGNADRIEFENARDAGIYIKKADADLDHALETIDRFGGDRKRIQDYCDRQ